jgi:hypothetical protein
MLAVEAEDNDALSNVETTLTKVALELLFVGGPTMGLQSELSEMKIEREGHTHVMFSWKMGLNYKQISHTLPLVNRASMYCLYPPYIVRVPPSSISALKYNIFFRAKHIPGKHNIVCDLLR